MERAQDTTTPLPLVTTPGSCLPPATMTDSSFSNFMDWNFFIHSGVPSLSLEPDGPLAVVGTASDGSTTLAFDASRSPNDKSSA